MPQTPAILDNRAAIQELDKSNVLGSVQALADQIEDAWSQVKELEIRIDASRVQNIVVMGMGGSALGPDVMKHVFKSKLRVPFEIYNDYHIPAYVNQNTLVLLASYSGTTEEILSAAEETQQSGAQVLVITTGGELANLMKTNNWPGYVINPQYNPSNQPRMAVGYAVFGAVAMFVKAGLLEVTDEEVHQVVNRVRETATSIGIDVAQDTNPAKQMAFNMVERVPVLMAAEHLVGPVHVTNNQINENAKNASEYRVLPELNHHLMEGLRFPQKNDDIFFYVLFNSTLYHPRTQKRVGVTRTVLEQAGIDSTVLLIDSATALEQAFEVIAFGAYVNFYLAMLNGIDPAPITTVDFFKEEMKK